MKKRIAVVLLLFGGFAWLLRRRPGLLSRGPHAGSVTSPASATGAGQSPSSPPASTEPTDPSGLTAPPAPEATRPSDTEEADRTTLAAQNFPTGSAATEEVAVDAEDAIPDSPRGADLRGGVHGDQTISAPGDDQIDLISSPFEDDATAGSQDSQDAADEPQSLWATGDGTAECPDAYPIKGNGSSHIYHVPGEPSYAATIAEVCFATEDAAVSEGFRPTRRHRSE